MPTAIVRRPSFEIRVERPAYSAPTYIGREVVRFVSTRSAFIESPVVSDACVSYSFTESLDPMRDTFRFVTTAEQDVSGATWFDKLEKRDLVFITELGEQLFVGTIERKEESAQVLPNGSVERRLTFEGTSLGGLLASFKLVLNQFLMAGNTTVEAENKKLNSALSQAMATGAPMSAILTAVYNSFFEVVLKLGAMNVSGVGTKTVLDQYVDFGGQLSREVVLKYPMALSVYSVGENDIWSILVELVKPPVHELYGRWNGARKKYEVIFRQAPFEAEDWSRIRISSVPGNWIREHTLGTGTLEVYTYFLATLAGSAIGNNKAMIVGTTAMGNPAAWDRKKLTLHGYRPLIVQFRYFDRDQESSFDATTIMKNLSSMLLGWFQNNDEFLSGTVAMMSKADSPRPGERLSFLEGEFYVESCSHSWRYEQAMETQLSLTRGYRYSSGTQIGAITNVGAKLAVMGERE
ncbi:hypothetical protein CMI37_03130 [Candidatus Pacearchaeota archaeon]|nr:hypothetical protein [Candidatus Pacearchaeota archaeon]